MRTGTRFIGRQGRRTHQFQLSVGLQGGAFALRPLLRSLQDVLSTGSVCELSSWTEPPSAPHPSQWWLLAARAQRPLRAATPRTKSPTGWQQGQENSQLGRGLSLLTLNWSVPPRARPEPDTRYTRHITAKDATREGPVTYDQGEFNAHDRHRGFPSPPLGLPLEAEA